jgi:hypothetical protein
MVMGMYKSPIELMVTEIQNQILKQQDEEIYKAVLHYVPSVDKEELLRALKYDRNQYEVGYMAGKIDAMDSITHCHDCQYHEPCKPYNKVWCPKIGRYMKADGFCSEGVMKDG